MSVPLKAIASAILSFINFLNKWVGVPFETEKRVVRRMRQKQGLIEFGHGAFQRKKVLTAQQRRTPLFISNIDEFLQLEWDHDVTRDAFIYCTVYQRG